MACYHPLNAHRSTFLKKNGKASIRFNLPHDLSIFKYEPIKLACGRCIGCRLERSRQWALRCLHESSLYTHNCFITLTYNQKYLPKNGSLPDYQGGDFQTFLKRLRNKYGQGIRFFHCGEYGEVCKNCNQSKPYCDKTCRKWVPGIGRPHYHACLFNHDFSDKILFKETNGIKLYISESLNNLWSDPDTGEPYGYATIGDVTFESAAYVARYITKKINGEQSEEHYQGKKPEYVTMSRGSSKLKTGGIGKGWYEKFKSDCYPSDFLVHRGKKMMPPKYYDRLFEIDDPENHAKLKKIREQKILNVPESEQTPERLRVKEIVKMAHFKQLKRSLEQGD